ncbi:hypothetical protein AYI70_g663 [Smittium culicis]|uniref:Uncharacterized protein n=1 Tax=Smittium culicis TaxID=133412 RepID=A0A1R1YFW7_9FUNG|nr:hypothetical protein AYI70_g663 [Smittium culicis]
MEFMSNLGGGDDNSKASIFEIIAQSKLNELIEPAIRYITSVLIPIITKRLSQQFEKLRSVSSRNSFLGTQSIEQEPTTNFERVKVRL